MGKRIFLLISLTSVLLLTGLVGVANALTINCLYGDIDNFGTGTPSGSAVRVVDINHGVDDGMTDSAVSWTNNVMDFYWTFIYDSIPTGTITNATLTIVTLDMEDAGAGDGAGGGPYDDKLYLDSVEVNGAFDTVYTIDGNTYTYLTPNTSVFNLDPSFFSLLEDGTLNVWLNTSWGYGDYIAIDYALLTIDANVTPVPEPATMVLLGTGLLGLAGFRRKFKK